MWMQSMKKEAVHVLMLNKVNANIKTLKEKMMAAISKDENFEKALFEVST